MTAKSAHLYFNVLFMIFLICGEVNGQGIKALKVEEVSSAAFSAVHGENHYTPSSFYYLSAADAKMHGGIKLIKTNLDQSTSSTLNIYPSQLTGAKWDSSATNIYAAMEPFWIQDTMCFVASSYKSNSPNVLFLVMIKNMKLVKTLLVDVGEDATLITKSYQNNELWMVSRHKNGLHQIFRYYNGNLTQVLRFEEPISIMNMLVNHKTNSFVLSTLLPFDSYRADQTTRIVRNYTYAGNMIWERKFESDTFLYHPFMIDYKDDDNLLVVYENSTYLRHKDATKPDYPITSNNLNPTLKYDLLDKNSGETISSSNLTYALRLKLNLTPLHQVYSSILNRTPNNDFLLTYTSKKGSGYTSGLFLFNPKLELKYFQGLEEIEETQNLRNLQFSRQEANEVGGITFYGSAIIDSLQKQAGVIVILDSSNCLIENCPVSGCTDPNAYNFDPTADFNDGSCHYSSCDSFSREVIFSSDQVFEFIPNELGRQGAADVMTITGSDDGVVYLKKSMAEMCIIADVGQSRFSGFHQKLCLPKINQCYLIQFSNNSTFALNYDFYLSASINNSTWSSLRIVKDVVLNESGLSYAGCQLNSNPKVMIFPNPTSETFRIHRIVHGSIKASLELYDVSGRLILTQDLTNRQDQEIDVSSFNTGIYIGRIVSIHAFENGTQFKIMKH